jgi:YD repeat-containing protein
MLISYYDRNKCENVKSVKERDGLLSEYEYKGECATALEHSTTVVVKGKDGKEISKSSYEYIEKTKMDGERYTYKLVQNIDGVKTETIYNECCGLPLEITRGGEKTAFEYDSKGHVTKKITPSEVTELSYDPVISKVTKVMKYSKTDTSKASAHWAQYEYDTSANLISAKNSDKKAVQIVYDHYGRIKALVDQDKRKLIFTYNEANRPVLIEDPAVGKIEVQYTNSGEIKKVNSAGGRKIALQVTSAFQNLLEIIRPAGVTLSF